MSGGVEHAMEFYVLAGTFLGLTIEVSEVIDD